MKVTIDGWIASGITGCHRAEDAERITKRRDIMAQCHLGLVDY